MLQSFRQASLVAAVFLSPCVAYSEDVLLFPYFQQGTSGASGVFMMYSLDGITYHHVNDGNPIFVSPFQNGNNLTRDPSIILGPDDKFHMTWTPRFFNQHIGHAVSDDLTNWTASLEQVWEPNDNVVNAWAPEVHYDPLHMQYVILFAGTDRNRFPNVGPEFSPTPSENGPAGVDPSSGNFVSGNTPLAHRMYSITTVDFSSFSAPELFFDPGFNVIDAQIVSDDRGTESTEDDRFVMVFKDERTHTNNGGSLTADRRKTTHLAESASLQGEFAMISPAITGRGSPSSTYSGDSEGQALVKHNGEWYLFIDPYTNGSLTYTVHKQNDSSNGLSLDPADWSEITSQIDFPGTGSFDVAHGTPFTVDIGRVALLLQDELGLLDGDLDLNGMIDGADWSIFRAHHYVDISDLTASERFLRGDLDRDGDNDFDDFQRFQMAYDSANGPGALQSMIAVPEPSAMPLLASCVGFAVSSYFHQRCARSITHHKRLVSE